MLWSGNVYKSGNVYNSMLWSGVVGVRENDGRANDDREKDVVPLQWVYLQLNGFSNVCKDHKTDV